MSDLNPVTNPDAQEALSRALGNTTVMILPLSSGRFALLDRGFNLHSIISEIPSAEDFRIMSVDFAAALRPRNITQPSSKKFQSPILEIFIDI